MTPQEIAQLKRQSPPLQQALREHRDVIWPFLRNQVEHSYFRPTLEPCECGRCNNTVYPRLKSPYNDWYPGWCIECVLDGFFTDAPIYKSPEEIEREREADRWNIYCPPPWELPDWPADYDGPSIEWS